MATLKSQSAEIEPFRATPEILLFLKMRFSNIFLSYMVSNYQNEIAPIFYYGISTKTKEKYLRIPNLQPPDWKSPYWMTLYLSIYLLHFVWMKSLLLQLVDCQLSYKLFHDNIINLYKSLISNILCLCVRLFCIYFCGADKSFRILNLMGQCFHISIIIIHASTTVYCLYWTVGARLSLTLGSIERICWYSDVCCCI